MQGNIIDVGIKEERNGSKKGKALLDETQTGSEKQRKGGKSVRKKKAYRRLTVQIGEEATSYGTNQRERRRHFIVTVQGRSLGCKIGRILDPMQLCCLFSGKLSKRINCHFSL